MNVISIWMWSKLLHRISFCLSGKRIWAQRVAPAPVPAMDGLESGETRWNHTECCCAVVLLPIRSSGELSMWICCSEIRSRMTRCFLVVSNHCDVDNLCFVASNEGEGGVGGPRLFLFSAFRILLKLLLKLSLKLSTWVMISNFVLEFDPFLDARNTIYFYHFCDYDQMHRIFLIPFELLKDPECLNDAIKST